ncbi:GNAT family N-acetyltransferase [Sphingomonas sp.]|jgi:phosphinothricin acetyltransferase|uniref:GNAT family N-acetyltransferase n=1 Tax=Sphingomonas sp. TaxID=28214 RepID=UPI002DEB4524|nr:GNAT family N-acetyltransferase [Sphingomonas sp.]
MRLRAAAPEDAARIAAIYTPYVTKGAVSFEERAPDAAEMRVRMDRAGGLYPWLVAEEHGVVLGYAYAGPFRARAAYRFAAETTIYVAEEAQGRGVGRRLYEALLNMLRAQGFRQAIAIIALPNAASLRLHERLGFRRAGINPRVGWKEGRWIDVGIWQLQLNDCDDAPAEPRPFRDMGIADGTSEGLSA